MRSASRSRAPPIPAATSSSPTRPGSSISPSSSRTWREAHARLCAGRAGWSPISLAGPERLPAASGGATAYKFRDPEGHPLELLQFADDAVPPLWRSRFAAEPQRLFFGVDHTAISVADADASVRFWAEAGLAAGRRRVNVGEAQARLDGLAGAEVEIVSLSPPSGARPGIELLGYRRPPISARAAADGSIAATAVVMAGAGPQRRDPDGHRMEFDQP